MVLIILLSFKELSLFFGRHAEIPKGNRKQCLQLCFKEFKKQVYVQMTEEQNHKIIETKSKQLENQDKSLIGVLEILLQLFCKSGIILKNLQEK